MKTLKVMRLLLIFIMALTLYSVLETKSITYALSKEITNFTQPPQAAEEKIELSCQYPVLRNVLGSTFSYDIDIKYTGGEKPRYFEFKVIVPKGFIYKVQKAYGGEEIPGFNLDPSGYSPEKINVSLTAFTDPGEYKITVEAFSGTIKNSIDLKTIITAKYGLELKTPDGILSTRITAGQEALFTLTIKNSGTTDLEKIGFTQYVKPSGWKVTFTPDKIDMLTANNTKDVEVKIKIPEKTISGDYEMDVNTNPEGKINIQDKMTIRVTIETAAIWGWLGITIIALVVVGLGFTFWLFGRR